MKELEKKESTLFDNIYEGVREDGATITCILDDYCVRYTVKKRGASPYRKPDYMKTFDNNGKEKCFKLATRALNKVKPLYTYKFK